MKKKINNRSAIIFPFRIECPITFTSPGGICSSNDDCGNLANTACTRLNGAGFVRSCECMEGYVPIPGNMYIHSTY